MTKGKFYTRLPKIDNRYYALWFVKDGKQAYYASFTSDFSTLRQAYKDAEKFMRENNIQEADFQVNNKTTDEIIDTITVKLN